MNDPSNPSSHLPNDVSVIPSSSGDHSMGSNEKSGSSIEDVVTTKKQLGIPTPFLSETLPRSDQDLSSGLGQETQNWDGKQSTEAIEPSTRLGDIPGYEILEELGRGGMGVVYRARQLGFNRIVALKMILGGSYAGHIELLRFRTEAEAIARLQHPHIVAVYEIGTYDQSPFFSLEYCSGGSLDKKLSGTPLDPHSAAKLIQTLAEAIQVAHDAKVIHRDLKPANILLSADGSAKITDFGLAKKLDDVGQTHTGAIMGTPSYMAPEQAEGRKDIGPLTDVYALGAILYDCLTGRPPFRAATSHDTIHQVITQEPVPPKELNTNIPRDLETITLKCLNKDPQKRYSSARELAEDLGRYLNREPIKARPVGSWEKAIRWCRRNPKVAALTATIGLLLLTVAVVTSVLSYELAIKKGEAEENARQADVAKLNAIEEQKLAEKARDLAQKSREVATEQRQLALNTVRDVLLRVDDLMKNDVKLAPLRIEIIRRMLDNVDRIRDHAVKNPLEDRTEAIAYARIGEIYFKANRIQDSVEWYDKAYRVLKGIADNTPNDPNALRNLAAVSHQLADAEWRIGNGKKARELHAFSLQLNQDRRKLLPENAEEIERASAEMDIAESYNHVAYADLRLGDPERAIANYLASDNGFANLPPPMPNFLKVRRIRLEIQVRLGDARSKIGKLDEAYKHYLDALTEREKIAQVMQRPATTTPLLKTDVGQSQMYLGDFFLMVKKDYPPADKEYTKTLQTFLPLLQADPDNLDLRQRVAATHYRLGITATHRPQLSLLVGGSGESVPPMLHFDECLKLRESLAKIDPKDTTTQVEYLIALARAGKTPEVQKLAARLLDQSGTDLQTLLQTACGLAICANGTDEVAQKCRQEAFRVLGILIDHGWKDPNGLEYDPDFDSVRNDKTFLNLVKQLKEKTVSR